MTDIGRAPTDRVACHPHHWGCQPLHPDPL